MHELARRLCTAFATAALATSISAGTVMAQAQLPELRVPATEPRYTAIVMDARTGEVMYEKRADSPRYPASITKIMTMYLAFEALASGKLKPTDILVVSPH